MTISQLSRRRWMRRSTLGFAALTSFPQLALSQKSKRTQPLRAGTARIDVTPRRLPVRVSGNIAEKWTSDITDPLSVRALVLDDGATGVALVVVDNLFMDQDMLDRAKARAARRTGILPSHMMVSATHTHSAPPVVGAHGSDPHLDYRDYLTDRIVMAIQTAHEARQPARLGWAEALCSEFIYCRRWIMRPGEAFTIPFTDKKTNMAQMNPGHESPKAICQTGPVDAALPLLAVQTTDGKPLALLASRHGHYAGAPGISADKYGVFAKELAAMLEAEDSFVGMLACGTLGDANCVDYSRSRRDFDYQKVGRRLAEAARKSWEELEWRTDWPLSAVTSSVSIKTRRPTREEVRAAQRFLEENVGQRSIRTWEENYARETVLLSEMPSTRQLPHQVVRIGNIALLTSPCEVFGSTGLKWRARSPFPRQINIGLANGYAGYLPPPDQHDLGGYTTWRARTSCLMESAERRCTNEVIQLLEKAWTQRA